MLKGKIVDKYFIKTGGLALAIFLFSFNASASGITFSGDGTYDMSDGDLVKLNSGVIVEPVYYSDGVGSNQFNNVKFSVYDNSFSKLGETDFTRVGWDSLDSRIADYKIEIKVNSLSWSALDGWKSNISFQSIYDVNLDISNFKQEVYYLGDKTLGQVNAKVTFNTSRAAKTKILYYQGSLYSTPKSLESSGMAKYHEFIVSVKDNTIYYYKVFAIDGFGDEVEYPYGKNDWKSFMGVENGLQKPTVYIGDGSYNLIDGDKVKMNNGLTVAPVYPAQDVVNFDVYRDDSKISMIGPATAGSSNDYSVDGKRFTIYVYTLGGSTKNMRFASVDGRTLEIYNASSKVSDIGSGRFIAQINWETNTASTSLVKYCEAAVCTSPLVEKNDNLTSMHEILISQDKLKSATRYYFKVFSTDGFGDTREQPIGSDWFWFETSGTKTVPAVTIVKPNTEDMTKEEKELKSRLNKLNYQATAEEKSFISSEMTLTSKIDSKLTEKLRGKILLQVEGEGQAWYVDPDTSKRYYLKNGESAYTALRAFGLGITTKDLEKIPVGWRNSDANYDSDNDSLKDYLEDAIGTDKNNADSDYDGYNDAKELTYYYNPLGTSKLTFDNKLVNRLKGKILLQIDHGGEAWYVNPADGKRYYMKDGNAAYELMRNLSVGIKNSDLRKVKVGSLE
ncbi:MAG: hypothetical protein WC310_04975 [Patescibacteria group bacterium]|jgi:hypothetical protein